MTEPPKGGPLAYAIPPKDVKKVGKWKQVEWDAGTDKHKEFFNVVANIDKLYIPSKDCNLTKEKNPEVTLVGPKVAL